MYYWTIKLVKLSYLPSRKKKKPSHVTNFYKVASHFTGLYGLGLGLRLPQGEETVLCEQQLEPVQDRPFLTACPVDFGLSQVKSLK